ncbi:hypothetical protein [Dactylosporangium matsuzakiense]|nr:hypothetical protein [Dactylosporangium matsuzakiense]
MSRNAVDACIAFAYRHDYPIMLIPSRRQVEAARLGGGYVGGRTTTWLADYVRANDPKRMLWLCRDHGGPYQHPRDRTDRLTAEQSLAHAMASFAEDIDSGFSLLHLDTSIDLDGPASFTDAADRLVALYGQCWELARAAGRTIGFEIGFEDQRAGTNDPAEFREQLRNLIHRLRAAALPLPTFVVGQTGTKVLETRNVGSLRQAPSTVLHDVRVLSDIAAEVGTTLKAHNTDYLSSPEIQRLYSSGVDAVNVAPELGVAETRALLRLMDELGLGAQREAFLTLAYESQLWRKWLTPGSTAGDEERAVMAGHYVFSDDRFAGIREVVAVRAATRRGIGLDAYLRRSIELVISRYAFVLPRTTDTRERAARV